MNQVMMRFAQAVLALALVFSSVPARACNTDPGILNQAFQQALSKSGLMSHCNEDPSSLYDGDTAILLFDEKGVAIGQLPQVDEDDTIYIVAVAYGDPNARFSIDDLRINTCEAAVTVRVYAPVAPALGGPAGAPVAPPAPMPYAITRASHCSSDSGLKASVKSTSGGTSTTSNIQVSTLALYRLSVGYALVYDATEKTTFRSASVKGETVPVIVRDEQKQGLGGVPFVTLHLEAVDAVRPRKWRRPLTWISPAVGISLTAPTEHIYFGLQLDPLPGLGLVAGWHALKQESLAGGYQEGDRIPGGSVPTDLRWKRLQADDLFVGINFDAAILARVIAGLKK